MKQWVDGALVDLPAGLPADGGAPVRGDAPLAPFETMRATGRALPLLRRHLARLGAAAARLGLPCAEPAGLEAAALDLLARNGHARGAVRLCLRPSAGRAQWELTTRAVPPSLPVLLLPCIARRPAGAPPADLKAEPRAFQDGVLAEARAGGADDGIVLGVRGEVLETATANLWLLLDGTWVTPPLDGRILPGIARALVLERASRCGIAVGERPCDLADLHRARALCTTNAVHGPRAAALPGAAVAEPDSRLASLWRDAVPD
jgi:para-aminobenzoate synthetase/4-amino-4-deoxychorismate lyase